ncbi:MAG: Uncharacterised protein [Polaribacter sp. SA4-10]|nr:MAG: Uncharacterised protein [Polaribacter sp. SA4-10]
MNSRKGDASEATKNSLLFFPTPIAIGLPNFATINSSGFCLSKTTIAYAPVTLVNAN